MAVLATDAPDGKLRPGPGRPAADVAAHQTARIHRAMIDIVAEHGYDAVKVRELVLLAGVSSRAFYENFSSKEDCFLRTHELVVRHATRRIIASQAGERDWRDRPRQIYASFAREVENGPNAARLALVEAYAAGPKALEQARRAQSTFEGMLAESFARAPDGIVVPSLVVEGMGGGISRLSRTRLLAGREGELPGLEAETMDWVLCYPGKSAAALADLDLGSVWRNTMLQPRSTHTGAREGEAWQPTGDRAIILAAVVELAATSGYGNLTATRIRACAGVSRAIFDDYFDGVEDCFVAALEQRSGEALAQAARAQTAGRTWQGGIYRAIVALCDQIAEDPILANVHSIDDFVASSAGALSRRRMIDAFAEQFVAGGPPGKRPSALAIEATAGATGALFDHYIIRDAVQRNQIAATLAFMALAPTIGAEAAVATIRREQSE